MRYQMTRLILTNIDEYREATNIKEYHIISKLFFLRIIIQKFMEKRQSFHVKNIRSIGEIEFLPGADQSFNPVFAPFCDFRKLQIFF